MARTFLRLGTGFVLFFIAVLSFAEESKPLSTYFPPSEDQGGWRTLLPASGEPSADQKANIRKVAGCNWDKLAEAWSLNAESPGATGLIVIRNGYIVAEWYRGCDATKAFNIYSSSKSYMSTA